MGILKKLSVLTIFCFSIITSVNEDSFAREREIKFLFPEPYTSAYGYPEGQSVGVYFASLDFHTANRPDLKGKYKMRWVGDIYKSPEDILNAVVMGAGEFTYTTPFFIEQFDPEWRILVVPGLFDDMNHFIRTMNTPVWKAKQEELAKTRGFKILKWTNSMGNFYIFSNKGPINKIEDLKGLKIRYAGQQAYANTFKSLGIVAVPMPYTEVVSSMQTNLIDGLLDNIFGHKYYDMPKTAKYVLPYSLGVMPQALVVNSEWWDSLPEKDREAIEFVIDITDTQKYFDENEAAIFEWWDSNPDGEVAKFSQEEKAKWDEIINNANKDYSEGINPELIQAIHDTRIK